MAQLAEAITERQGIYSLSPLPQEALSWVAGLPFVSPPPDRRRAAGDGWDDAKGAL